MQIKTLRIATRKSKLAMWQSEFVAHKIKKILPSIQIEIIGKTTTGDKILNQSLSKIGGKGLFIKEIEQALVNDEACIAVHSLKDMPATLDPLFTIAAVCEREDPRDALIGQYSLYNLPKNAIIGTSSVRRAKQLECFRSDLKFKQLRGNVDSRIEKLKKHEYDAIILAAAGLIRLDMQEHIKEIISPEIVMPACSQGAIGIECLSNNKKIIELLKLINHIPTFIETSTERKLNQLLGGSCDTAIAIYSKIEDQYLTLKARLFENHDKLYKEAMHKDKIEYQDNIVNYVYNKICSQIL